MKILVLADASSPHTERWLASLESRGHETTLASFQEPWEPRRDLVRLRGSGRLRYWMAGRQIRALAREHDAVLAHFLPGYGVSAWRAGVPFVLVLWGSDILVWSFRDRLRFGVARRVLSSSALVISDSITVRRILQLNFGYPPERILVFPFGPEEDALSFPPVQKDENLVIFPRALESTYSPVTAVEALASLAKKGRKLHVVFTMGGRMLENCRRLANESGISADFNGPMPRSDYLKTMASAGIYLSLALSDATPVSLLEAMALGAFPVVSDLPATREWIVDGLNGLLVDPRSPVSVSSAINKTLDDQALAERARALNHQLMRERGPWTRNLPDVLKVLASIGSLGRPSLSRVKGRTFWSYL